MGRVGSAATGFAAVVSVSGVLALPACKCAPSRPVPVLQIHGKIDPVFLYSGALYASAPRTVRFWERAILCDKARTATAFSDGRCGSATDCAH